MTSLSCASFPSLISEFFLTLKGEQWFDQADPTSLNERESIAATAFQAQSAYLYGNFSQTMDCSLRLFDVKEGDTADRAQVLDLLLRSSMKCGRSEEVLVQAKDYVGLVCLRRIFSGNTCS